MEVMANIGEFEKYGYLPETVAALRSLIGKPAVELTCIHGDGVASGLYETQGGCVVFPDAKAQFICPQHRITDGFINGLIAVALERNFAETIGDEPDFYLVTDNNGLANLEERIV